VLPTVQRWNDYYVQWDGAAAKIGVAGGKGD